MNVYSDNELFPYLDGWAVEYALKRGKSASVVVRAVKQESVTQQDKTVKKIVIYFEGWKKGLILSKGRVKAMVRGTNSPETNDWIGATLTLKVLPEKRAFKTTYLPIEFHDVRPATKTRSTSAPKATKRKASPANSQAVDEANAMLFTDNDAPTSNYPVND